MNNAENKPMLRIEKNFISALPLMQYEGKIVLVEDEKTAQKAVRTLAREKVLGFDTETRPSFRKGAGYMVSLVQLCGKKCAYLFRLDFCGGVPVLFPIFENPNILKVGVAVKDDVLHLKVRAPFDDAGFVDASKFTRAARIENTGLRALTAHFLGGRISKAAQVSNWAAKELSPQQIVYAATDAWISRELFLKLQKLGIAPKIESAGPICATEESDEKPETADVPAKTPGKKKSAKPRDEKQRSRKKTSASENGKNAPRREKAGEPSKRKSPRNGTKSPSKPRSRKA
ncbi:MAG: 3'-5' exonuclease domain-containing protein 2 [Opitutales bacterium]|nr:3'-5' exonuclease domain-containing protein 2 [Opitutales bacterium]